MSAKDIDSFLGFVREQVVKDENAKVNSKDKIVIACISRI